MSNSSDINGSVVPTEVSDLISESQTIQGWMERLAGHRGDADPAVFDRVQSDYQGRLDKVTTKLVQHRSQLVSSLEARQGEVDTLRTDRDRQAGHLEEARLRHAVGEFSDTQWDDARGSIQGSLSELDELLGMEEEAVSELAAIIDSIGEGGTPPAVDGEAAPVAGVEDDAASADDDPAVDLAAAETAAPVDSDTESAADEGLEESTEEATTDDALADVEITVEADDEGPVAAATEPAPTPSAATVDDEEAEGGEYLDELEFLESLSLDESDQFDAVSAMLDDEEPKKEK